MSRLAFSFVLLFAFVLLPTLSGCGGTEENTVVTGNNDLASIEAEEAEAENQEEEGETGGPRAGNSDEP